MKGRQKMRPALLIIPQLNGSIDRTAYLADCINKVMEEGFMPLNPDVYEQYITMDFEDYVEKTLPMAEAVFFFIDFGIDARMMGVWLKIENKESIRNRILTEDPEKYANTLPGILKEVSEKTGFSLDILKSKSRKRELVDARFVYFIRATEHTKEKPGKIAMLVKRDHACVWHGLKQADVKEIQVLYHKCFKEEYGLQPNI